MRRSCCVRAAFGAVVLAGLAGQCAAAEIAAQFASEVGGSTTIGFSSPGGPSSTGAGMSFTSATTGLIDSLSVHMGLDPARAGEMTFSIWTRDSLGMPGSLLVTRTLTSDEIVSGLGGATSGWLTIDFSSGPLAALAAGEGYAWTATTTTVGNYNGGPENFPVFNLSIGFGEFNGGGPVSTSNGGGSWNQGQYKTLFSVGTIVPTPGMASVTMIGLAGLAARRRR